MPPAALMPFASVLQSRAQEQDLVKVEVQKEPGHSASPKAGILQVGLMLGELLYSSIALACFQAPLLRSCLAEMLWQPAHPAILLHCSTSMLQSGQQAALRIAEIRCSRFLYSSRRRNFVAVPALPPDFDRRLQACCAALQGTSRAKLIAAHASAGSRSSVPAELDLQDREQALAVFGHNEMVLPVASFLELLVEEM